MKVLYVVSRPLEINASSSVRNMSTINGLLEIGCEVELITTEPDKNHPSYDKSMSVSGIKTHYIQQGNTENIARIGRKIKFLTPIKKIIYQIMMKRNVYDNLVSAASYIQKIDINLNEFDFIISSSDPKSSHLLTKRLLELHPEFKGKWIQIWGDPFIGDITFDNTHVNRIKKEEHSLISNADKIIYVSPLTMLEQQKIYPDCSSKMTYEPIPYIRTRISNIRNLKIKRPIEIAYCGDYISSVRNLVPLYEAVVQSNMYHLTICGNTDLHLKQTPQVTINPRVSRDMVSQIEENADILVHLSNLKGTQIPGKIYQYAGTNKPILFIMDGDKSLLRDMFGKYRRFSFADNNCSDICAVLSDIVNGINLDVFNEPVDDFSAKRIASRLVNKNAKNP